MGAVLGLSCGSPGPLVPTAVITATPGDVPLGDDFSTVVELDASLSSHSLSLVPVPPDPDEPPLQFEWHFSGSQYEVVQGSATDTEIHVTMAGDRPLHVELTVINGDGGIATSLRTITVTDPITGDEQ